VETKKKPTKKKTQPTVEAHNLTTNDDDDVINIPTTTQPAEATYKTPSAKKINSKINLSKTIYIVFDLETTGLSSVRSYY
jgi:DNA polymerase III alpha subunit (gram-positive type)